MGKRTENKSIRIILIINYAEVQKVKYIHTGLQRILSRDCKSTDQAKNFTWFGWSDSAG